MEILSNYTAVDGDKYEELDQIQVELFMVMYKFSRREAEFFCDAELGILCY